MSLNTVIYVFTATKENQIHFRARFDPVTTFLFQRYYSNISPNINQMLSITFINKFTKSINKFSGIQIHNTNISIQVGTSYDIYIGNCKQTTYIVRICRIIVAWELYNIVGYICKLCRYVKQSVYCENQPSSICCIVYNQKSIVAPLWFSDNYQFKKKSKLVQTEKIDQLIFLF